MFAYLIRCVSRTMSSRDPPELAFTPGGSRRGWRAGVVSIARELRSWRAARTLQAAERPQEPDILPNPWLSY